MPALNLLNLISSAHGRTNAVKNSMIILFIQNTIYRWREWRKATTPVFVSLNNVNRENR